MTDEVKRLVKELRTKAAIARGYEWGTTVTVSVSMTKAADMIEKLSADLERDERQYGRDAFGTLVDEGAKLEADREAWKRRAEVAESDLQRASGVTPCEICKHYDADIGYHPYCEDCCLSGTIAPYDPETICNFTWAGPCDENGGERNA